MKTILVTGVGAIIGYGVIKSLRKSDYDVKIIGMDIYDDAVGQHWCDCFEKAVLASSKEYPCFLKKLILKHNIDLVIPCIEQDIDRMSDEKRFFSDLNVKFVLPSEKLNNCTKDKWLTYLELKKVDFPAIKSYINGDYETISNEIGTKMLLKPRNSYASKGIFIIENKEDFLYWQKKTKDNFMVQEIVGDDENEYTVAVFGNGDGIAFNKITLQRKLSADGATAKAMVVENSKLNQAIDNITRVFKPLGPTNYQFRYHKDEFLLLEINPRISSSTSIRTAFGYNEAQMCIEFYLENKKLELANLKKGRAIRYIEDVILYDCNNI